VGKILLVEDEDNLGATLKEFLQSSGHPCNWARTATEAKKLFSQTPPEVVLMDIGLPDQSGLDLARELRRQRKDFVLLFLSAQNAPEIRLEGLELGAQDYITKPFALKELILRLTRILEQNQKFQEFKGLIQHGPLKIWFDRYEVQDAQGNIIPLTQKECAILGLLYKNRNIVFERDAIIDEVWGAEAFPSSRTVDNYMVKLRRWCESDPHKSLEILSVRGIGYKLVINN